MGDLLSAETFASAPVVLCVRAGLLIDPCPKDYPPSYYFVTHMCHEIGGFFISSLGKRGPQDPGAGGLSGNGT